MNKVDWRLPPDRLALKPNEVHVWRVQLTQPSADIEYLEGLLATEELARARRFHFTQHQVRFTTARGVLRVLLGNYLSIPAKQIRFQYTQYGKPVVAKECVANQTQIQFNLSHSEGLALYAFTNGRMVGIDLEFLRQGVAIEQLAKRFFSPREQAILISLPKRLRTRAFFNAWTRKEAYIKAQGDGLSLALESLEVSLVPGEPALLLKTPDNRDVSHPWSIRELNPGPGCVGAIVVEGHDWEMSCFQLKDLFLPG